VAGEPDGARALFESAVAQQLRVQAKFDVLEHELGELSVKARAEAVRDLRGVDRDAGRVTGLTARRCQGDEEDEETAVARTPIDDRKLALIQTSDVV
jgi:hypothetical protein